MLWGMGLTHTSDLYQTFNKFESQLWFEKFLEMQYYRAQRCHLADCSRVAKILLFAFISISMDLHGISFTFFEFADENDLDL